MLSEMGNENFSDVYKFKPLIWKSIIGHEGRLFIARTIFGDYRLHYTIQWKFEIGEEANSIFNCDSLTDGINKAEQYYLNQFKSIVEKG